MTGLLSPYLARKRIGAIKIGETQYHSIETEAVIKSGTITFTCQLGCTIG